jgi:hypothetical protein
MDLESRKQQQKAFDEWCAQAGARQAPGLGIEHKAEHGWGGCVAYMLFTGIIPH